MPSHSPYRSIRAKTCLCLPSGIVICALAAQLSAAVVYTDPEDDVLDCSGCSPISGTAIDGFNVDFDGDGSSDFVVERSHAEGDEFLQARALQAGNSVALLAPGVGDVLDFGEAVDNSLTYGNPALMATRTCNPFTGICTWSGPWASANHKFLGFEFEIDGDTHYGWVRLTHTPTIEAVIHDFAYESTPDTAIECGFIPEPITCPADLDQTESVDAADLAQLLGAWGPNPGDAADLDGNTIVDAADLAQMLGAWGPCS